MRLAADLLGRGREVDKLRFCLDRARDGRTTAALLTGPAGIGKSRLLDHLAAQAASRGVPFHLIRCDRGTSDLRHLVASVMNRADEPAPFSESLATSDPTQLHANVAARSLETAAMTVQAAVGDPLVVAFDDVHAAPTAVRELVDALVHQLREHPTTHLLLAMTTRSVPHTSGAGRTIRQLAAYQGCASIDIKPLDPAEEAELVHRYQPDASPTFIGMVGASARGNPLRIRAAVQVLVDRGVDPGAAAGEVQLRYPVLLSFPDDDPVAAWIASLAPPVQALLECLAVFNQEATITDLSRLAGTTEVEVESALLEAASHGIVTTDGQLFWFGHRSFQDLVYGQTTLSRRRALHGGCALLLHEAADDLDGSGWLALGRHLRSSPPPPAFDAPQLVAVHRNAGNAALDVSEWFEAAGFFHAALQVAGENRDIITGGDRARLLFHCGLAHYFDHDVESAGGVLAEAAVAAEIAGNEQLLGTALIVRFRALNSMRRDAYYAPTDLTDLNRYIDGASDEALKAMALEVSAEAHITAGDVDTGRELAAAASAAAQRVDDARTRAMCAYALGYAELVASSALAALPPLREAASLATSSGDWYYRSALLARLSYALLAAGELTEAEGVAAQARDQARLRGEHSAQALGGAMQAIVSMLRGDFSAAQSQLQASEIEARRAEYQGADFFLGPAEVLTALHLGETIDARAALARWEGIPRRLHDALRRLVDAYQGTTSATRADDLQPERLKQNQMSAAILALEVQRGLLEADLDALRVSADALQGYLQLGVAFTPMAPISLERLAAELDLALDRPTDAERRFDRLAAKLAHHGANTELAMVRLAQAKVAAVASSSDLCRRFATDARRLAERLGLRPVEREAGALAGSGADQLANVERRGGAWTVILVTDITGSTRVSVELGDVVYHDLISAHHEIVRSACARHNGNEVHDSGDGLYFWFQETADALEAARNIQRLITLRRSTGPKLEVKVALAAGEPLFRDQRPYGLVLNRAARIVDEATSGQILVDEPVAAVLPAELVAERWEPRLLRGIGHHVITMLRPDTSRNGRGR